MLRGMEGVEFVELRTVQLEACAEGRLDFKRLIVLPSHSLQTKFFHTAEDAVVKIIHTDATPGSHHALVEEVPALSLSMEVEQLHVVVAVIEDIGVKLGRRDALRISGHKGQREVQHVSALALHGGCLEGDGTLTGFPSLVLLPVEGG